MNKTKNIGLFILLLIQAGLIVYLYQPAASVKPAAAIFADLQPQKVNGITITDENGKTIILRRKDSGWLVGADKFPGNGEKIERIIKKIAALKETRLVARSKGSRARLKVGKELFNRKITLSTEEGKKLSFFLGTAPNSKSVHFRRRGDDNIYQVSGLSTWQLGVDNPSWWQTKYIDIKPEDLMSLSLKGKADIELSRDGKKSWRVAGAGTGQVVNKPRLNGLISTVCSLDITSYQAADFKPRGKAAAVITYKVKNGTEPETIELKIWPPDVKTSDQVIKSSGSRFYARLPSYILKEPLGLGSSDLLQKQKSPAVLKKKP
ncbi:DUF4340 domain-containing protein [Desulfobacterota bacterium M19]